jgi:hypothetical protein
VLDAALQRPGNGTLFRCRPAPRRLARDRRAAARARSRKHRKLTSRSSPFCVLKGDAGMLADSAVTSALAEQPASADVRPGAVALLHP